MELLVIRSASAAPFEDVTFEDVTLEDVVFERRKLDYASCLAATA